MSDAGKAERKLRIVKVLLPFKVDLKVVPLDGVELVLAARPCMTSRFDVFLLPEKEVGLIDAVDEPVGGRLAAGEG